MTFGESPSKFARRRWRASYARADRGVRLNEHLEHPDGAVVFQQACKMGLEDLSLSDWARLPQRPIAGLAQVQEPGGAGGAA